MSTDDRRRSPRQRVAAVASLQTFGSLNANNQALATVHDLSQHGIGIETGQPPVAGQSVSLRIVLDERILEIRTRATRVEQRGGSHFFEVGLDWTACTEEEHSFLAKVLSVLETEPLA